MGWAVTENICAECRVAFRARRHRRFCDRRCARLFNCRAKPLRPCRPETAERIATLLEESAGSADKPVLLAPVSMLTRGARGAMVPAEYVRQVQAQANGHEVVTCAACGSRATRETVVVHRPGLPSVRRVLVRCWRQSKRAFGQCGNKRGVGPTGYCPVQVVSEEEVDGCPNLK